METKIVTVTAKVQKQMSEKLKVIAKRRGLRFSSFIYQALQEAINKARREGFIRSE